MGAYGVLGRGVSTVPSYDVNKVNKVNLVQSPSTPGVLARDEKLGAAALVIRNL